MARIDLNADLGEEAGDDDALLRVVSSASVACGFHAGSPAVALATCRRAREAGVAVGAHPSYADREGFGRRRQEVTRDRLVADIVYQVGALEALARAAGTALSFVKPHGALYNAAAVDPEVAAGVVEAVIRSGGLALVGLAGSVLVDQARRAGLVTHAEAFADRAYAADGTLVPRDRRGAVHSDPATAAAQALDLALGRGVATAGGGRVDVSATTICVHGDSPGALETARAVRRALEGAGVEIGAFARPPDPPVPPRR